MGFAHPSDIEKAGKFLLSLLFGSDKGAVNYSTFYDGTEETAELLARMFSNDGHDLDFLNDHGCILIDHAVDQLEEAGLLERTWLTTKLADGEPDYRIRITASGCAFVESGSHFTYVPSE